MNVFAVTDPDDVYNQLLVFDRVQDLVVALPKRDGDSSVTSYAKPIGAM